MHEETLPDFDGETYNRRLDHKRLGKQLGAVFEIMSDGVWRTLEEISTAVGAPEASVSARLRDLRKPKFGGFKVEARRWPGTGLWLYRLSCKLCDRSVWLDVHNK